MLSTESKNRLSYGVTTEKVTTKQIIEDLMFFETPDNMLEALREMFDTFTYNYPTMSQKDRDIAYATYSGLSIALKQMKNLTLTIAE